MASRRILILFSDTGGGHRAAAQAISDALALRHSDQYETILIDGIVKGAMPPFNLIPKTYLPIVTYSPRGWGTLFHATNTRLAEPPTELLLMLVLTRGIRRLLNEYSPDLVVSVHSLLTSVPYRVFKQMKPHAPFVTVVTDLFDIHVQWFAAAADMLVVPTQGAFERGLRWGFSPERIRVTGLPVSLDFSNHHTRWEISELRSHLGLVPDRFTILIVGGGEGMGRLEEITRELVATRLPIQLVVIAGRNELLRKKLEAEVWPVPVRVTGFVTDMPNWMRASDLIITKAGPQTVMEVLAAERPMLLSGFLEGQEEGNMRFVVQTGVGVLKTDPKAIAEQTHKWFQTGDNTLARMCQRARELARPNAALEVAELLDNLLQTTEGR